MPAIYRKWFILCLLLSLVTSGLVMFSAIWLNHQLQFVEAFQPLEIWLLSGFVISQNVIVLPWLYWLDKRKAVQGKKERIPELVLHLLALFGGGLGALYSQQRYRHKTQKPVFQWVAWLGALLLICVLYPALLYGPENLFSFL